MPATLTTPLVDFLLRLAFAGDDSSHFTYDATHDTETLSSDSVRVSLRGDSEEDEPMNIRIEQVPSYPGLPHLFRITEEDARGEDVRDMVTSDAYSVIVWFYV